jgi:hypothetical protein
MKMRNITLVVLTAAISLALPFVSAGPGMSGPAGVAHAQDGWKAEFEAVCARTQDTDSLTSEELKNLVDRCDKLKPRIEKLDETQRKVYLKRLRMCRDLLVFVLESREKK